MVVDPRKLRAVDIMRRDVVCLRPDMTIERATEIFLNHKITGAPVVDVEGHLVGIVSIKDIVRHDSEPFQALLREGDFHTEEEGVGLDLSSGYRIEGLSRGPVGDILTPEVVTADEQTAVADLAKQMVDKGIHRIVITRGKILAGIVTSIDLVRALTMP